MRKTLSKSKRAMEVKVYAVRVGNRYGIEFEKYLKDKIPDIEFLNEEREGFKLQWNKLHFFQLDIDRPICVIDIDIDLINDYTKIFEYPIQRGEFLTLDCWWDNRPINGGFYKFYPSDVKFVYDEFKKNKDYWERYFIENGTKPGPVNGEEDFVYHMVKDVLEVKYLPGTWATKMKSKPDRKELIQLNRKYPGKYLYLDKFNQDIKLIHYLDLNRIYSRLGQLNQN